jgi:hypothetical protein
MAVDAAVLKATDGKKEGPAEAARQVELNKWLGTPMKFAEPVATRRR